MPLYRQKTEKWHPPSWAFLGSVCICIGALGGGQAVSSVEGPLSQRLKLKEVEADVPGGRGREQ